MTDIFSPQTLLSLLKKLSPLISGFAVLFVMLGLYFALIASPPDYQQEETVRIMYVHVPSAWMSLFVYAIMTSLSIGSLVWKNPLNDVMAKSAAPIGMIFTIITLVTGSLWGKPIWGTWWEWDARMTSVLILLFIYMGYMALWNAFERKEQAAKACALLCVAGCVNLPIIKFSVDWWNTLHQPASVIKLSGPSIHGSMLMPLLCMAIGFTLVFFSLWRVKIEQELLERKLHRLNYRNTKTI